MGKRAASPRATHGSSGFTLIEVMIVVVILAILAAVIVPRLMGRPEEAKRTKAQVDIKAIEAALNLYKLDNGFYPTTDQGLQALVTKPEAGNVPRRWNPDGYLETVPVDPWGNPYAFLSDGNAYTLKSYGADGAEGGEGKYADIDSHTVL